MWINNNKKSKSKTMYSVIIIILIIFLSIFISGCSGKHKDLRSVGFKEPLKESQVIPFSTESKLMGKKMSCLIYLPKGYAGGEDYPVWYALHGYSSDETMWPDSGITKTADELIATGQIMPIIMVFPDTQEATYKEINKDLEDGKVGETLFDQYVSKELIPYIDDHYYTIKSAKSRYIGGPSMGGLISLRIAFHHTNQFSKVGAYCSAVLSSDYSDKQLEEWLYPNEDYTKIKDITKFDKEKGFDKLTVQLDGGKTDIPFVYGEQSLYEALQKKGIKSEFKLCEGGHFLRTDRFKDYLEFYAGKK